MVAIGQGIQQVREMTTDMSRGNPEDVLVTSCTVVYASQVTRFWHDD